MLKVDGSRGEGGGQIVRSSLAMSLLTGKSISIENIRTGRKKPGLMRQHLAAVRAAAKISDGTVDGAHVASKRLVFHPREVAPGSYHVAVGTAGSSSLVLQTVLPVLLIADDESELILEGGTHNPWAPPFDFLRQAFVPLVDRMGPSVELCLRRPGFFPAGGGSIQVKIRPCQNLSGFDLLERGKTVSRTVRAIVSDLPRHIAQRECDQIARKTGWPRSCFHVEEIEQPRGPGNVVLIELRFAHVTELFTGFGRVGVKAEQVANSVLKEARAFLDADVPVGPHLADQLLLPLGIAAFKCGRSSSFRTTTLTPHSTTHIALLQQQLGVGIEVESADDNTCTVHIAPGGNGVP